MKLPFLYSKNETTIGTWIDGKPLYRKIYTFTRDTGSSIPISTPLGIDDLDRITFAYISYKYTYDGMVYEDIVYAPDIGYGSITSEGIELNPYISCKIATARSNIEGIINIHYTKTTDESIN